MSGRKTISLDEIKEKLPLNLKIVAETYQNTQTYATFIDNIYGEFKAKPYDVINRGRKHPLRNLKRGGGNAPPKYSIDDIKKKLTKLYGDEIKLKDITYKGIAINCIFIINEKEYLSKPSRILSGKMPREIYLNKLREKNILSLENFKKRLNVIRDDVEVIDATYDINYKKKKSLFRFKNFTKTIWLLPYSVLNGALHPNQRTNHNNIYFNKNNFQNSSHSFQIRKKIFQKQIIPLPKKKILFFLENRGFDFRYNSQLHDIGDFWDFIVFKNGSPKIIIEIDGEFINDIAQDQNPDHPYLIKDRQRFENFNNEIIYLQCNGKSIEKLQMEILKVFDLDYQEWIENIVNQCLLIPFPYPSYTSKRMKKDYQNLCHQKVYKRNFYTGNSIITNFHRSIYHSNREYQLSPYDALHNKTVLARCVKNRFIYSLDLSSVGIARGFEINRIASRVSVFQPSLARMILEKYCMNDQTIIDPFSGFSGRMLGVTSLNKKYFGFDVRSEAIDESQQIVDFLKLKNVTLGVKDIINDTYDGEYDLLFTCPPYENKEIWFDGQESYDVDFYIDQCLKKIKAKRYIFVIDDVTTKYEKFVMDYVYNQSHFGKNKEKLLIIN